MKRQPVMLPDCGQLSRITEPVTAWYQKSARVLPWRSEPSPYRVWVSEVMLQQTRVEAVKPYFIRFMDALPTVEALARASDEVLYKLWEGLGYYSRARNLRRAAREIVENGDGELPADFDRLLALPGIGRYTAGAIASIAFGLRVPAVDGNVLRVVMRVLNCAENIGLPPVKRAVEEALRPSLPHERPGDFNQALMELGATVCLPNGAPQCASCPLAALCGARRKGTVGAIPVRAERRKRRVEQKTVFLMLRTGENGAVRAALRQRPATGLLAGLWEYPQVEGPVEEARIPAVLRDWGLTLEELLEKRTARHIFTHVEWELQGYFLRVSPEGGGSFSWADRSALQKKYAVPSAFSAFSRALAAYLDPGEDIEE